MNYAYDKDQNKWVVLINDVIIEMFDTEEQAKTYIKNKQKGDV